MNSLAYQLVSADSVMVHVGPRPHLVRDDYKNIYMDVDTLVASGDCFVTLATLLDRLTTKPYNESNELLNQELEKSVNTLLYLQRHFKIISKQSDYRQ